MEPRRGAAVVAGTIARAPERARGDLVGEATTMTPDVPSGGRRSFVTDS